MPATVPDVVVTLIVATVPTPCRGRGADPKTSVPTVPIGRPKEKVMGFGQVLTTALLLVAAWSVPAGVVSANVDRKTILLSNELSFTRSAGLRRSACVRPRPSRNSRPFARLQLRTEEGWPEIYLLPREQTASDGEAWVDLRLSVTRELLRVPGHTLNGPCAFGTSDYSILTNWPRGGVVGIHGTSEPWLIPGRPSHGCIRMRNADITYLAHHLPLGAPVDIV
jgi:L,D-transpeptidase catalytic domain